VVVNELFIDGPTRTRITESKNAYDNSYWPNVASVIVFGIFARNSTIRSYASGPPTSTT